MELLELPKMAADDKQELEVFGAKAFSATEEAQRIVSTIHTPETEAAAGEWCKEKLGWCDRIKNSYLGRVRDYFYRGHKDAVAEIERYTVPWEGHPGRKGDDGGAVGLVKRGISAWREQERQRIAYEQAKANAAAKKKAEDEALANAVKAEAAGHKPIADAILANAGAYVPPVIETPKFKTHSGRMIWTVQIDDTKKGELLKMIAENPEYHAFVILDGQRILKHVQNLDGNVNWPGVTCKKVEQLSMRRY